MKSVAYRGHPALTKAAFVAECRAHREADRLVKGLYGEDEEGSFRGCAVGCAVRTIRMRTEIQPAYDDHQAYATLVLGGRIELAFLEDRIFEGLPSDVDGFWPERFAQAVPDGADLSAVANAFLFRMLREVVLPVVKDGFPDVAAAVERVATGVETGWSKDDPAAAVNAADCVAIRSASACARAAGRAAGYAAARAADYAAADTAYYADAADAADSASEAARAAGYAAARAADYAAVAAGRASAYARMADILCDCLAAAPVPALAMENRP